MPPHVIPESHLDLLEKPNLAHCATIGPDGEPVRGGNECERSGRADSTRLRGEKPIRLPGVVAKISGFGGGPPGRLGRRPEAIDDEFR